MRVLKTNWNGYEANIIIGRSIKADVYILFKALQSIKMMPMNIQLFRKLDKRGTARYYYIKHCKLSILTNSTFFNLIEDTKNEFNNLKSK